MSESLPERRRECYLLSIPEVYRSFENWPTVDKENVLDPEKRARLERLSKAASLFLKGENFRSVLKVAQIQERRFFTLLDTALSPAKDGTEINGTRAFVKNLIQRPRIRFQPYIERGGKSGYSGMFGQLLRETPAIEKRLVDFLNGEERPNKVTPHILHAKFLKICAANSIPITDYPFNTKSKGYHPLQLWYSNVYCKDHLLRNLRNQHGSAVTVAAEYELGDGQSKTPPIPYGVWVIDEFKVDLNAVIELPMAIWGVEYVEVSAFQVVRIRSVGSICCNIAWHMCLRKQASGPDIIQVFRNAVLGQPPAEQIEPSMTPMEGAGFPQNLIPELKFVVPLLVYLDNALSHLFNPLQQLLQRLYGGRVMLGIPGSPKGRPEIESAISRIATGLIHQMPAATGTGPTDPLRKQADVPPDRRVQVGLLEQAIDSYLANENVATSENAGHLYSFTRLRRLCSSGQFKGNYLPEAKRRPHHFSQPIPVTVHQDHAHGRLAWVMYRHRRYSSPWLKTQPRVKKRLFALADYQDLRKLVLVDELGAEFTTLTVEGPWSKVPHDLRMLQIYAKHKSDAAFRERPGDSPLFATLKHLAVRAKTDSKAALDYAYIMKYLKVHLAPEQIFEAEADGIESVSGSGIASTKVPAAQPPTSPTGSPRAAATVPPVLASHAENSPTQGSGVRVPRRLF